MEWNNRPRTRLKFSEKCGVCFWKTLFINSSIKKGLVPYPLPHAILFPAGEKVCKNPAAGDESTMKSYPQYSVPAERQAVTIDFEKEYCDWSSAMTRCIDS
jgi:hypothetical protein